MTLSALGGVGPRPAGLPIVDGILFADLLPPDAAHALSVALYNWHDPYVGVTTAGVVQRDLYSLQDTGATCRGAVSTAQDFLASLRPNERLVANLPVNADWAGWHPQDAAEARDYLKQLGARLAKDRRELLDSTAPPEQPHVKDW